MENLNLPALEKLNLSHNLITVIQGLEKMTELKEIKINENKIEAISEESFANNYALRIADLGKNAISTSTDLIGLKGLKKMQSLSLLSNPVLKEWDEDDAQQMLPRLEIFNNKKLVQKLSSVEKRGHLKIEDKVKKNF